MGSLFGMEWSSLRTWPEIRKSNDLWPMSEPCCVHFHSSGLILHTNKCSARSHRSGRGCFLEVPLKVSESSVSRMCREAPRGSWCCPGPWHFENAILPVWFLGGFLALAAEPQQMANWTSAMRPSGAILMPHMLYPAAMTSWRLLSQSPSQPSPWLHNTDCGE